MPASVSSAPPPSQKTDGLSFRPEEFAIVVPDEFSNDLEVLLENQQIAIKCGSVYPVKKPTQVYITAWSFKTVCAHINLPPTPREKLDYKTIGYPVSLVVPDGRVIAGTFLITATAYAQLRQDLRNVDLQHLEGSYDAFLKK
jgi:hypothetical protein